MWRISLDSKTRLRYNFVGQADQSALRKRGAILEVSYKKLWKLLIDKDMKKKDLQALAGISWASVTKLSKNETVSMEVLMKVCGALKCDIGDIMELISVDHNTDKQ